MVVKLPAPDRLDHTSDTWDYLQIARELYVSHRFESLFTYVPFLPDWEGDGGFPVLWRQPGFPWLIAGAFAIRGRADPDMLLWIQGAAVLLLPLATYVLARRFLTPGWAFVAGCWALLSPVALAPKSPLVATTWFAVIIAFLAALLVSSNRWWLALLSGTVLALAVLFRFETWMLLPGLLLMSWLAAPSGRTQRTLLFLSTAGILLVPWFSLRTQCAGEGFTLTSLLYHDTHAFPGWTSSRTLSVRDITPLQFVAQHFGDVAQKTVVDVLRYGRDLTLFPSPFLAPFVWLAVLRPPVEQRSRALVLGTILAAITLVLLLSPLEYSSRFLAVFAPLFTVVAVISISRFVRYRREIVIGASLVGMLLLGSSLLGRTTNGTSRIAAEDMNRLIAGINSPPSLGSGFPGIVLSDAPTIYAWIWEGQAVWAPLPEDLPRVLKLLDEFGTTAVFTRAAGRGDGITPDTIEKYFLANGVVDKTTKPPLFLTWPPTLRGQGTYP